jgi:hypothetical protein
LAGIRPYAIEGPDLGNGEGRDARIDCEQCGVVVGV